MGIELVKAMVGHPATSRLSGNAHKVLLSMALQALDKPKDGRPAGLYFGGWGALSKALGYDGDGVAGAAHTAVKRAVRELKDGTHITPLVVASRGNRQSYLVHPGGLNRGSYSDPQSPRERGSDSDPKRGSDSDPKGGHSATLLGLYEEERGLTKDIQLIEGGQVSDRARAGETKASSTDQVEPHAHVGGTDDDCQSCGLTRLNIIHARRHRRSA